MVSQQNFQKLPLREKIKMLYEQGSFVTSIRYYGYKVNLYTLGDFCVEVFYNHKLDTVEKIEPLEGSPSRMKFYSDQIRLPKNLF
ncbi:MAG: hypothetical protein AAFX87_28600 [Bacteroidota bacterium]